MFITDLDGTLFRSDHTLSQKDMDTLEALGRSNVVRVLATGRSIFSLERSVAVTLPIDYLVFSTGLGVARYPSPRTQFLKSESLSAEDTRIIASRLTDLDLDYMVQDPVPDNHAFSYRYRGNGNSDFKTRLDFYQGYCRVLDTPIKELGPSSQFITMVPKGHAPDIMDLFRKAFTGYNVIQTTSPFDGQTLWVEIFPKHVSKSHGVEWLARELDIDRGMIAAVGNDYNDEDLLDWAGHGFVVANGPEDLKSRFELVATNNENGVSEAARLFLNHS